MGSLMSGLDLWSSSLQRPLIRQLFVDVIFSCVSPVWALVVVSRHSSRNAGLFVSKPLFVHHAWKRKKKNGVNSNVFLMATDAKHLCQNKSHHTKLDHEVINSLRPELINPLRAKFVRGNINIYLHFMSSFYIDMAQVLKIFPQVRRGPTYST